MQMHTNHFKHQRIWLTSLMTASMMRIGEFLQQWLQHWINLLERWSEQCKLVVTDSFIWSVSKIIYLILLLVDIHAVHWDKIQSCSKRNTNAVLRQIRTKFGVTRSFRLKTIYVNSFSAGFNSYTGGVHTIKKSVLELILVIHPAGAYHVFPEHEVTKSITTPTLDGMPVHHKGTPCQTMLRICW